MSAGSGWKGGWGKRRSFNRAQNGTVKPDPAAAAVVVESCADAGAGAVPVPVVVVEVEEAVEEAAEMAVGVTIT